MADGKKKDEATRLVSSGRPKERPSHPVTHPPERASTILFPTYEDFTATEREFFYGRFGTRTHRAFEASIGELEAAEHVYLAPSGLAAVTLSLLAFAQPGSHILVTDSAYDPVRGYCDRFLKRMQVETEYYDPHIGSDIAGLIRENTAAILAESPGSLTFEIQDIPALGSAAKQAGVPLLVDNTWSAGVYFKPLDHGATVSIQAATKYIGGHSDCLLGTIAMNDPSAERKVANCLRQIGSNVSADDVWLAHRGLRTLAARLPVHQSNGIALARWLEARDDVVCVLHPALESHPDHELWKRDFTGATGLFGFELPPCSDKQLTAFCNALEHFGMGYSWGGFESLCIPVPVHKYRTVSPRPEPGPERGPLMRIHAGLESADDLIMDLEQAFAAFDAAGKQG
ncbi:cystathionine beta-lyase [Parvularcula flava]|uniref:Cystathionine beta-lyase n=1 Tax=Aquisalinus luteolus TaxID=1566827 RepID=A0A8J3ER19_9PROT|nr:cystathionine beta-lyase [Aquisalinus luteolus]NHK27620.1 cystathionine beta-lyase [Aquisalinus luteolus]GGH95990.1 cystathionine beta-lyase [Aquisalinus luteolus]